MKASFADNHIITEKEFNCNHFFDGPITPITHELLNTSSTCSKCRAVAIDHAPEWDFREAIAV